jgi:hypothetical protein
VIDVPGFLKIDRLLLGIYFLALFGLLMFPVVGPGFRLLGFGSDKWMHIALFGGLAVLLRWNLSDNRHAGLVSIGVASAIAVLIELAQGLVEYRSAESWDALAGLIGAFLGATGAAKILLSPIPQRLLGLFIVVLGLMVGVLFLLADLIGVGDTNQFGPTQMVGISLGTLIVTGGVGVFLTGARGEIYRD